MELEGDGPAPRHFPAPDTTAVQNLRVTPESVVALAAMFRSSADNLYREVRHLDDDLRLRNPWLGDPVSRWALEQFNLYFVDGDLSFKAIVEAEHARHEAMRDALVETARRYGLTEELIAAGFTKLAMGK